MAAHVAGDEPVISLTDTKGRKIIVPTDKVAYVELGLDYAAEKASVVDPSAANAGLPAEIWHARDGISSYPTLPFVQELGNA